MIELTKGQELALAGEDGGPLTRVRMGLGWDKLPTAGFIGSGAPDVDLDATAVQFASGQLFDLAFYNNLQTRDGSVVHLGDNISGRGEGDDEAVTVDLGRVHGPVDTVIFLVSSYQGHSLEWVANAYCRLVDDETDTSSPASPSASVCRTRGWRWPSSSATARGGGSARSARGSRSRADQVAGDAAPVRLSLSRARAP